MPRIKVLNYFFIFLLAFIFVNCNHVSALSISSTYRDVPPNNSNATNLLALAQNYDSFKGAKFVIFSDSNDSYFIVWSDNLKLSNDAVVGDKIEYLRYYRYSSGYNYQYVYGTDTSFRLAPSSYHSTSNIDGYGFVSANNQQFDIYYYLKYFLIFMTAFLFIIALTSLKRSVTI